MVAAKSTSDSSRPPAGGSWVSDSGGQLIAFFFGAQSVSPSLEPGRSPQGSGAGGPALGFFFIRYAPELGITTVHQRSEQLFLLFDTVGPA